MIEFSDFLKVQIAVGTVLSAKLNPKAQKPAYVLTIDFGDLGTKTSSAQIVPNYQPEELVGRQICAVMNFEPKRVAGVKSEVLVLAVTDEKLGNVLLGPERIVNNGMRIL